MSWTQKDVDAHYASRGEMPPSVVSDDEPKAHRPQKIKSVKPTPVSGPLDVTLVLWGHCPSKKSNYRVSGSGGLITDPETKAQMEVLTLQAMLQWSRFSLDGAPVEHPEVTTTFFVASARQDEDGMYVTLMDVLQKAGVFVNDNIKRFNGRKIHEPCEFVSVADERVEITVRKS